MLILAALSTVQIDDYALNFQRDAQWTQPEDTSVRKHQQSTQSFFAGLQEVNLHQVAERFPDEVCRPLHIRHF